MNRSRVSLSIFCMFFFCFFLFTQARHHHTKHKHHTHHHKSSEISAPPFAAPEPCDPPAPAPEPSSPPDNENADNSTGVFDVRKFGAIGDGVTDDTEAFKMAWDSACQVNSSSSVIHVPYGFFFMIQSTIFTGPCQGQLVLQVMYLFVF